MDLEEMRKRAASAPDYRTWEDAGDVAQDAIERVPALAADVLALIAEVERLTNLVATSGSLLAEALRKRDAALLKARTIEDGAADMKAIVDAVKRFADKQPSSVPDYLQRALDA